MLFHNFILLVADPGVQCARTRGWMLRRDGLHEPVEFLFGVGVEESCLAHGLCERHGRGVGVFLTVVHEIDVKHDLSYLGVNGKGAILAYCALTMCIRP